MKVPQRVLAAMLLATAVATARVADAAQPMLREPANRLDSIGSCYRQIGTDRPPDAPQKALFVLIDQTTAFDPTLQQSVVEAVRGHLRPGHAFAIGTFSAYLGDRYTDLVLAGRMDPPMPPHVRDDTGKAKLRVFDQCLAAQTRYAHELTSAKLRAAFGRASDRIAKSDIFTSLHDFGQHAVRGSKAKQRTLLLASDMLENSTISTFYASQTLRLVDAKVELQKLRERQLVPDLSGVRVYVLGAGLLAPTATGRADASAYRDPVRMQALERFWSEYFREAKAELVEFGKPQLLQTVD